MTGGPGRTDGRGAASSARGRTSRASFFSRGSLAALAVVLLVGAGLRAAYLSEIARSPEFTHPAVDAHFSDYWARALVSGDWSSPAVAEAYGGLPGIQERPYFRPPGYPHFLAVVYRAAGPGYMAPRLAQMLLGLASALLAFALARLMLGRAAGVVAAAFMATYWGFIYFEGELEEPSLLIFLSLSLLLALVLTARSLGDSPERAPGGGRAPTRRAALLAVASGVLLGLAVLVRANAALLFPFALAWLLWVGRRRARMRGAAAPALALTLGAAVAVAPAAVRNWVVARDMVPVSSNFGINLYIGNNAEAEGLFVGDAPTLNRFGSCFDYPRIVSDMEREEGRPLKDSEVSAAYARRALAFVRANPAAALRLTARKAYLFWAPHEISLNRVVAYDRARSRTLRLIPWTFPLALSLGLAGGGALAARLRGLARARGGGAGDTPLPDGASPPDDVDDPRVTREGMTLLALFAAASFLSFLPFFATAGYRIAVVPALLIPGAYAATRFGALVAARDARRAAGWAAAVGGLCALASVPLVPYEPGEAKWHFDRGVALVLDGRHAEAVAEYESAIAAARGPAPEAVSNLGMALAATGRLEEAEARFREALERSPSLAVAHLGLADALSARGRTEEAVGHYLEAIEANPASARARCNLGSALAAAGRFEEAVAALEEAVAVNPWDLSSANNLAWILATAADPEARDGARAVTIAERVARAAPDDAGFADTLAAAYAEERRFDDAVRQAEEALGLASNDPRLANEIRGHLDLYRAHRALAD